MKQLYIIFLLLLTSCRKDDIVIKEQNTIQATNTTINSVSENIVIDTSVIDLTGYQKIQDPIFQYVTQALDGSGTATVYYTANNKEHIVTEISVGAGDFVSPIHFIKTNNKWRLESFNYGPITDGGLAYDFIDKNGSIAWANYGSERNQGNAFYGNVYTMKTNPDNTLSWNKLTKVDGRYNCVTTGDINFDNVPDIIVTHMGVDPTSDPTKYTGDYGVISFLSKSNTQTYEQTNKVFPSYEETLAQIGDISQSHSVFLHDFDGDKIPELYRTIFSDLVVIKYNPITKKYSDIKKLIDDKLYPGKVLYPISMKSADMNGDGIEDLVVFHEGNIDPTTTIAFSIWTNDGKGNLTPYAKFNVAQGVSSRDFEIGDINGDGINDIFNHSNAFFIKTINDSLINLNPYFILNDVNNKKFYNPTNITIPKRLFKNENFYDSPSFVKGFFINGKLKVFGYKGNSVDKNKLIIYTFDINKFL